MNMDHTTTDNDAHLLGRGRGSGFPSSYMGTLLAHHAPRDAVN